MGSNSTAIPTTSVAELKYLSLLARDYPTQAAAASAVISLEATAKLPKGTEHYISDLHGEDEAFIHLLNSASGVIREKVDLVLGENVPKVIRAELATLIYYPARKLPLLKARYPERFELEAWYRQTLLRLIDVCRFVSSKHTREYVRSCLPQGCGHIIDELLHAHFEDHNKTLYYGQIVGSIIANDRADAFIIRLCELIKRLAVDKLHIIGDLFDRGPRPDIIMDMLMNHHSVDIQWGNHDILWMGAAAGSRTCIANVLNNSITYNNLAVVDSPSSKGTGNEVDMEQLMLWNPDVILFAPDSVYASVGDDPLWQSLTAIQNGSYYEAPMGPYNWMGFPPSVQRYLGMLWMAKLLYPDAADYDLQAEVTEYFDLFYHCALTGEQYEALMANSIGKQ